MRSLTFALLTLLACAHPSPAPTAPVDPDAAFAKLEHTYVVEFLRRNPTVSTYLGGAGLDPSLVDVDGQLRDYSPQAMEAEGAWLAQMQRAFEATSPTRAELQIDREVALAQLRFLQHAEQVRHYPERSLDTYTSEPMRALDWAMQGFTPTGETTLGTPAEWRTLTHRVRAVGSYFAGARAQLELGVKSGRTPDKRMLVHNGLEACAASVDFFEHQFPEIAAKAIAPGPEHDALLAEVRSASLEAARAYSDFRSFLAATFFVAPEKGVDGVKPAFAADHFAVGEEEYNWALQNNLRVTERAGQLYEMSWQVIQATRAEMARLAREIGQKRHLTLPTDDNAAVRAVFNALSREAPRDDAAMVERFRDAGQRLLAYARKTGLFDVPADYQLDFVLTPPALRASISGAAYYPAPPFKGMGVGRFYITPTGNDPQALAANNQSSLAALAAHEGFPGHDWNYKVLTRFKNEIGPVRWLTPGAVEDSSSMWEDSMSTEGWAFYSEQLMSEPQPGAPHGFYTPEERLYQLDMRLFRELRIRVDTGIHTGRLSYAQAVDLQSELIDFLPGSCQDPAALKLPAKRVSCDGAEHAIYRYSRMPTQALTYWLGKHEILDLRAEAEAALGPAFDLHAFHTEFMRQGTIPPGYFRAALLERLRTRAAH